MKQMRFSDERIAELLRAIPQQNKIIPSQEKIDRTVLKANEILNAKVQTSRIGFAEFVVAQVRLMKKKWWVLQGILLFFAGEWIAVSGDTDYTCRGLSILASLFVILVIPELWKNTECRSIEIEESSLFDLRRVYAAKLMAFGIIDTVFLTFFCIFTSRMQGVMFAGVLKQFVFPVLLAATICLVSFSSKKRCCEATMMIVCIVSNVIWIVLVLNETVYSKITPLLWVGLFGICSCLIIYSIRKVLHKGMKCWEVQINGLSIG